MRRRAMGKDGVSLASQIFPLRLLVISGEVRRNPKWSQLAGSKSSRNLNIGAYFAAKFARSLGFPREPCSKSAMPERIVALKLFLNRKRLAQWRLQMEMKKVPRN